MDSFDQAVRKSQEAGQRLKKMLEKGSNQKSIENTMKTIQRTESTLKKTQNEIASLDKILSSLQESAATNVDHAVKLYEEAVLPQAPPNLHPASISTSQFWQVLKGCKNIVIVTGKGICSQLGLPLYQSHNFNREEEIQYDPACQLQEIDQALLLTTVCFAANRKIGWKWISNYEQALSKTNPTKTHILLDEVAQRLGREGRKVCLVTENIDNYHQAVQSSRKVTKQLYQYPILPMHGNIMEIKCRHCSIEKGSLDAHPYESYAMILTMQSRLYCPCCEGPLVPSIKMHDQFYNQLEYHSESIQTAAREADAIVVIGSSNQSSLTDQVISEALAVGKKVVEIGKEWSVKKQGIVWVNAAPEQALEEVKTQINQK